MDLANWPLLKHATQTGIVNPNYCFSCRKIIKISAGSGLSVGTVLAVVLIVYFEVIKKPNQSSNDPSFGGPYKKQAIATDTKECSNIGEKILKDNGSAVDAAIAAMFCLGVVSMHSSGIGGGGIMLVYNRSLQEATVIDFRETASSLAHRDMFKDNKEKAKKGILFCFVFSEVVLFENQGNNITRTRKRRENG